MHPFDIAGIIHDDLVVADLLSTRIQQQQGARELLVAELVASLSLHLSASDVVVAPAVEERLESGESRWAHMLERNRQLLDALAVIETSAGTEADEAVATIATDVRERLATLGSAGADDLLDELRHAVGDEGMIALGNEFVTAKRHAPSRPHPNGNGAISRIVSVIDRVKDASSGRAVLAAADGSGLLDDETQDVINALAELGPKPAELLDPEQARRQPAIIDAVNRVLQQRDEDIVPTPVARVDDTSIETDAGDLVVRIYDAHPDPTRLKPVVVYVHGGGWVIGDVFSTDASPRGLALLVDAVVVSVGYRTAPEHPFPAAHDDVAAALRWVREHAESIGGDPVRVALVGEDAGANMALAATLGTIRDLHPVPVAQVLVCPIVSTRLDWPSCREHADARPWNTALLRWSFGQLFDGPEVTDARLDPLSLPDAALAALPPTLVITAERDPLHDQGVAFAERLKDLGVAAAIREYQRVPHEFFGMGRVSQAAHDAQVATAAVLHAAFNEH